MYGRTAVAALCLALGLGFGADAAAQKGKAAPPGPDTKAIAVQVVNQIAGVKEGEVVFVNGDVRDFELLEDLTTEVQKAGAHPLLLVGREKFGRRWFDEVPEKFDAKRPTLSMKLWQLPTVSLEVVGQEYPTLLKGVPAARLAAHDKFWEPLDKLQVKRKLRRVFLGNGLYPTAAMAKRYGLPLDQLAKIFWGGVAVTPTTLQATAEAARATLAKGKEVRVTNPNGTDLKFRIVNRKVNVSDGTITPAKVKQGGTAAWTYLPAGEVMTTPVPGSAEGKVVVDRIHLRDGEVSGMTVTFKAGKVASMTAQPGAMWDLLRSLYDGAGPRKNELGSIDLGVNPSVTVPKGSKLLTWIPAGMVTLTLGWNLDAGGDNASAFASVWHLPGSTVLVDGKPLVENGVLKVGPAATASK
jgi:aminopeptidase